jgi:hypothetical protein
MDDLIDETTTNGKLWKAIWNKSFIPTTAGVAGEWDCLARGAGNPPADSLYNTGTNLAFQAVSGNMSAAGGMYAGGDVSPDIKVITNASIYSAAATTAPCIAMLVDLLGFYRITSVTATTAQTLDNSVTIPRYTTGAGVQAFAWANNSVALGAATPTITITYTNSDGVSGQTNPSPLPSCKTAAPNGKILYSGTGSGKYGPFIPLKAADKVV